MCSFKRSSRLTFRVKSTLCNFDEAGFPRLPRKIDVPAWFRSRSRGPICTGGHLAVRGATESKVRLFPFCLAERQVSPSARPPPLLPPSPLEEYTSSCFCCHRASHAPSACACTRARRISRYSRTSGSWSDGYIGSNACGRSDRSLARANELENLV